MTGPTASTAAALTQELVRIDTTNPPGREAPAIEVVRDVLAAAEVDSTIITAVDGRPNLVARITGTGERPNLILHGHLDVVDVDGQNWAHPPFGGAIIDGLLHGRGTLDNKAGVAMLTHAFAQATHTGRAPSGDVLLLIVADSETGGSAGLAHLLDHHPELTADARYAIGEFGGFPLHAFGRRFYRIGVGLKGYAHLRLRLRGRGGHGSQPTHETVVGALGRLLERLDNFTAPHAVTPIAEAVIEAIATHLEPGDARQLLDLLDPDRFDDVLTWLGPHRSSFEAMFRDTANPTIVRSGAKFNVIPTTAQVEIDARLLPGHHADDLVGHLQPVLGDDVELEVIDSGPAHNPPHFDDGLLKTLGDILIDLDSDAIPVPYLFSESPDGRLFAEHGIQHYGYLPMDLPPDIDLPELIHGPNERVPLAAVEFGTQALQQLLARY